MTTRSVHDPVTLPSVERTRGTGQADRPGSSDPWVEEVLADAVPGDLGEPVTVRMVRPAPKRLADVVLADGSSLVLKQYVDDRGAWTRRFLNSLVAAGFGAPSGPGSLGSARAEAERARFGVTPALGWSAAQRTLVAQRAPGRSWRSRLPGPVSTAADVAEWLAALQTVNVALPDRTDYRADAALRHQGHELTECLSEHGERLRGIVSAVSSRLSADGQTVDLVTSHGDLHPGNLFVAGPAPVRVIAIDLDTVGLRRASYDVGYLVAQLLVTSWMRTGSFDVGGREAATLWHRWLGMSGQDAGAVPAQVARALIQSLHFERVTYGSGTPQLSNTWLDLAETVLAAGVDSLLSTLPSVTKADS